MIRNNILLLCVSVMLFACDKGSFVVNGTFDKGVPMGDSVYLQYIDNGRPVTIGRAAVKDNSFSIKGTCEKPCLSYVVTILDGRPRSKAEIYAEPGEISLKISSIRPTVSGTELNTRLQEYNDSIDILDKMFEYYYSRSKDKGLSQKALEEADKGMKVVSIVRSDYVDRFMKRNINNEVSNYILSKNYETFDPEKGLEYIALMPQELKSDTLIKHIEKTFVNKIATAEGKPFVDFPAFTNDGRKVKLSDYVGKGKMTVLNIWGTNRNELQKEIAAFKAVADAHKEHVQFVSFIVENDVAKWNAIIKEQGMWWPQISDLKSWASLAIFSYGVNSYPYNIVFAADGTILRKGVGMDELASVIAGVQ